MKKKEAKARKAYRELINKHDKAIDKQETTYQAFKEAKYAVLKTELDYLDACNALDSTQADVAAAGSRLDEFNGFEPTGFYGN